MKCPCVYDFAEGEERIDDETFVCAPHRIGNSTLLCGRKASHFPYHILVGPEWPCMLLSYCFMIVPTIYFIKNVALASHPVVLAVTIILLVVLLIVFSAVACSDPGIVFMRLDDYEDDELDHMESGDLGNTNTTDGTDAIGGAIALANSVGLGMTAGQTSMSLKRRKDKEGTALAATMECGRCNIDRPRTATHCYECGVCVDQLDHHCPWSGKCIAKKNIQAFRWFLGVLLLHVGFVVGISIYAFIMQKPI